jgi:hypothetical protein
MDRWKLAMLAAWRGPGGEAQQHEVEPRGPCLRVEEVGGRFRALAEIGRGEAAPADVGEDRAAHDPRTLRVSADCHRDRLSDVAADLAERGGACHPPATTILRRAGAVAGHMGLDRHRALRWAAVWAVLQTCQAWREDQADLEACLSGEQFEHLLAQ